MKLLEKLGLVRKRERQRAASDLAAAKTRMFELRRLEEAELQWEEDDYARENSPRALELLHEARKTEETYKQIEADKNWLEQVFQKTVREISERDGPQYLELFQLQRELKEQQLKARS